MTVAPELLPTSPAFSASMQFSPSGMKIAGGGVLGATLLLCVISGVLSWDQALTVLDLLLP
ncbi:MULTISPECIES: hypothetical protein [Cryobacterium]|uniref:hypothetical protein n=1 Tax=Cryobacterium TaxID=69578 RepID=UPI000CD3C302|nr:MULTISPECIES: hypothetical protein [Cryobacterium]TFC57875.1 hypothetical protein E3O68_02345 [Cryobacterium sp. TMB3-1-2]TFC63264.1 hypothetical protein E3O60_00230 [Cryobacterium sp. TMB1-7]TFC75371.1 hypothetical protein E3T21_00070 [Cryobacterium sp. TMB3-15]TFC77869.1 hypothetical protein E3T22_04595 [Cryobacterium sp. TMB3-10]TFD46411.1 hypothetical protein E3T58_00840 [Cryobacterium sp. TMB3-12]